MFLRFVRYHFAHILSWLAPLCILAGGLVAYCNAVAAQNQPTTPPKDPALENPLDQITVSNLEGRIKQAEETADLDPEVKKKVVDLYRNAITQLQRIDQLKKQEDIFRAATTGIQDKVKEIRSRLNELKNVEPFKPGNMRLSELEQLLGEKNIEIQGLKTQLTQMETEPAKRAARRKELRDLIIKSPADLEDIKKQLQAAAPENEAPQLTQARQMDLLTRRKMIEQDLITGQLELSKYDAEDAADIISLERDRLIKSINVSQTQIDELKSVIQTKRDAEAQIAVNRAQQEAIRALPALKPLAEENQKLAEEAQSLNDSNLKAEALHQELRQQLDSLRLQFTQTKQKVDTVGLTGAIGLLLRKQRGELPDFSRGEKRISDRRQLIDDTHLAMLEYTDQRAGLGDLDPYIDQIVASADPAIDEQGRKRLIAAARKILESQTKFLDLLVRKYNTYFNSLVELDTTERELVSLTDEYRMYIDERVLWIRSAKPLYSNLELDQSDWKWFRQSSWQHIANMLIEDATTSPIIYLSAFVVFAALLHVGRQFRRDLAELSQITERGACVVFLPTAQAILLTLVISLPLPGLLFFLGWRFSALPEQDEMARGLSYGFFLIGCALQICELLRQICRPQGLAESHFEWPTAICEDIRRTLPKLMLFLMPLTLVIYALQSADPLHGQDVLERIAFILCALIIGITLRNFLHPEGNTFRELRTMYPGGWIERLDSLWSWLGIGLPLVLAGLSFWGYHYTARQISFKLFVSLDLLLSLILLRSTFFRFILVLGRRVSIAESRRRALNAEQESKQEKPTGLGPQQMAPSAAQKLDISINIAQFKRVVGVTLMVVNLIGLWFIWREVFPALNQFDRWSIWTTTVSVTEQVKGEGGATTLQTRERIENVTVVDLWMAILAAIVTFVAAHNIPGMLEMALLQRLPLDNSVRYAISTLARYLIVVLGIIFGFNLIGLGWSQVQWLVTALTFGLAFGLQEIFANFVAGLILLFERPIRIGDIVTIEDISGVVSKIRMRATTISNWDRKEFIVPNKDLITGKLLNWTLSDQINRIVINVGIAYGSDTQLATDLLLKAATEHPLVLNEPPPMATFEGFGESSLNLVLRCFLPNLNNRLVVTDELHKTIYKLYHEAGIEISFPQRDLHIRSLPPGLILPLSRSNTTE